MWGEKMLMEIDFQSETPIYLQIRNQVVVGIAREEFEEGENLPSVRQLAEDTGVNAMTVSKAYSLLKDEGYITTNRRNGTQVNVKVKINEKYQIQLKETLLLLVAEAKIHGKTSEELSGLVQRYFEEFKQTNGEE
ncbi:MAG: GntR family transcriptional regulator [Lactobacillales bacterium]|jgi:DNA-binding transcriptional regulator YhcF (GntR family)|nr:GntR family transcriptional regulator [Lactobacillales bacterium]